MIKRNNTNKGITLIALVITIIVMLILVAVTISMAVNGGLFNYAGKAVGETKNEIALEQELAKGRVQIEGVWYDSIEDYINNKPSDNQGGNLKQANMDYKIIDIDAGSKAVVFSGGLTENPDEYFIEKKATNGSHEIEGITEEFIATRNGTYTVIVTEEGYTGEIQINITGIEEEKFSPIYETTTEYTDDNGDIAKIPAGFAVGTSSNINTIEKGLVITDAVDSEGYSIGNEFVWVPVASETELTRTDFNSYGEATGSVSHMYYHEPHDTSDADGSIQEIPEYNLMKERVLEHKGFYVGRYESGVDTAKLRTGTTQAQKVVIKKGVAPYNFVEVSKYTIDVEISNNPAGLMALAKSLYSESESVNCTLIYGCEWDAMCRYIENANKTTPTKDTLQITGRVGDDNSKNIYDLAGNCSEITMEGFITLGYGIYRTFRGGSFQNEQPVSYRLGKPPTEGSEEHGFRCAVYLN